MVYIKLMFVWLILQFIVAPLAPGQDPYAILGVERKASPKDIKAAFRVKTRKFHPDINHEPDANRKWILISDAYELLSDPKKREKYDKFGIIDETLQDFKKTNYKDKIKTIIAQESARRSGSTEQYGEFGRHQKPEVIIELNDRTFESKTSDGRPWVLYVYQGSWEYSSEKSLLEELFTKTGLLFGIARLQYSSCPQTMHFLGVRTPNQIIVFDREANRISHFTGDKKLTSLTKFAAQKFGSDVTIVENDNDIVAWRKSHLDKLHVILFSDLPNVPSSYELVAAFLKRNAVFAFASINQRNLVNFPRALGSLSLEELPTYIIYRMGTPRDDTFGGPVTPIVAPMDLDAGVLSAVIRRYHYPVFAEVNQNNVDRLCSDYCVIWVNGVELADDIKRGVNDMNIPTGMINATTESAFVSKFGLEAGDFIIIKRKSREMVIWKEITTWVTFRRKFELMNNGIGRFQKVDFIPEFTKPSEETAQSRNLWKEQITALFVTVADKADQLYQSFMALPATLVLVILALLLIVVGELISCAFGSTKEHVKEL